MKNVPGLFHPGQPPASFGLDGTSYGLSIFIRVFWHFSCSCRGFRGALGKSLSAVLRSIIDPQLWLFLGKRAVCGLVGETIGNVEVQTKLKRCRRCQRRPSIPLTFQLPVWGILAKVQDPTGRRGPDYLHQTQKFEGWLTVPDRERHLLELEPEPSQPTGPLMHSGTERCTSQNLKGV